MKKLIALLLVISSLLPLCACGTQATGITNSTPEPTPTPVPTESVWHFNDDPDAISAASESVVMISVYNSKNELIATGSGFPLFEPGIIITNYHVIEGGSSFEANTESETYFKIDSIVAVDADRDIAILHTNAKTGFEIFTPGDTSALKKGEKVLAIGSPLGLINTVSDGMYSNIRSDGEREYLQFTAPISPGSSGGALFNDKGEVIGITTAHLVDGQNLNLAVPIENVIDVWEHKDDFPDTDQIKKSTDIGFKNEVEAIFLENQADFIAFCNNVPELLNKYEPEGFYSPVPYNNLNSLKEAFATCAGKAPDLYAKYTFNTVDTIIDYYKSKSDIYNCLITLASEYDFFTDYPDVLSKITEEQRTSFAYYSIHSEVSEYLKNCWVIVKDTKYDHEWVWFDWANPVPYDYKVEIKCTIDYRLTGNTTNGKKDRSKAATFNINTFSNDPSDTRVFWTITGSGVEKTKVHVNSWTFTKYDINVE